MTEAEAAIADLDAALAEIGESVTLQRLTTGPNGARIPFGVVCQASVRLNAPQELLVAGGGEAPNTHVVISPTQIAAAQWPGPPKKDDRIIIQGQAANVEIVSPLAIGGQFVRFDLQCRA